MTWIIIGFVTPKQNFSKLSPLAKIDWGNKWSCCNKRQNFSNLSPHAKPDCGSIHGVVTPKEKTLIS